MKALYYTVGLTDDPTKSIILYDIVDNKPVFITEILAAKEANSNEEINKYLTDNHSDGYTLELL